MSKTTRTALGLSAVALSTLLLAGCGGHGDEKKGEEKAAGGSRQTVTAVTVAQTNLNRTVTASGTVSAWEEVPVGAETGGLTAVAVYVDEGAYVRQGQPLVQMNDVLLRAQLQQQQAAVQTAEANAARDDAATRERVSLPLSPSGVEVDAGTATERLVAAQPAGGIDDAVIGACAEDALKLSAWQEWAKRNGVPVEE